MNRELITCNEYEDMLLSGKEETGSSAEKNRLRKHLHLCPSCARLQVEIAEYQTALSETELEPDPVILPSLKTYLVRSQVHRSPFMRIYAFFNQPVPRYQTLFAAGLAFVVFLFTYQNLPYSGTHSLSGNTAMKIQEEIYNYENRSVSKWILSESQKVGISISEDSLFNDSFYRAM